MKSVYNKREILSNAWALVKSTGISFKEALVQSWRNAKIKAIYKLNETIRVCVNSETVKKAIELKSKIVLNPVLSFANGMSNIDKQAAILFYAK